jgi:hypothetical protein
VPVDSVSSVSPAHDPSVDAGRPAPRETAGQAIPIWAQLAGLVILLAFVGLSVEAYFGPGLRARLFGAGDAGTAATIPARVLYDPGDTARVGQKSTGSEGQERTLLEGDSVLLGATHQIVRLGPGGRAVSVPATEGAVTSVANLGVWQPETGRLGGAEARAHNGQWLIDEPPLPSVGAALNPPGTSSDALTDGFTLGPDADAGRVRRVDDKDGPAIRFRASRKVPLFSLDSRQPLPTLDGVLVSVSAVVRAQAGKTIALLVNDTIDSGGTVETVTDRRPTSEEWTKLTVRRRMLYPSPADSFSVGLVDPDGGDWFEVRDVQVVLGVAP